VSEVLGYAASSAVLVTFLMRSMMPLRLVAILSNVLFLAYGYAADIHPVLLLHAALLPINITRLATLRSGDVFSRLYKHRHWVSTAVRLRHMSLFILGLAAGSFGLRARLPGALTIFNQWRRSFV